MRRVKKRTTKWRKIGNLILITAIIIILYPLLTDFYAWYEQAQLNKQYQYLHVVGFENDDNPGELEPNLAWAILKIPDIGLVTPVIAGTSREKLAKAPGWYTETALPGDGNTAIAGHRTMHGGTFSKLSKLTPGNRIVLTYDNYLYHYQVESVKTIASDDWSVIEACGYPALTLTTCISDNQDQRLSVRAKLIKTESIIEENLEI
jgi:sortase A